MRRVILAGLILWACGVRGAIASPEGTELAKKSELRKGDALMMERRYEEALAVWEGLEAAYPRDPQVLMRAGVAHSMLEDYEESERAFSSALELDPENATIVYNYGLMKLRKGEESAAEGYLTKALELFPNFPGANYHLGLIAERNGEKEAAKELYVKEMNENPNQAQAWQRYFLLRNEEKKTENGSDEWVLYVAVGCALVSIILMSVVRKPRVSRDAQT